jgi:DNA-binding transcriptional ArsR family regulator
MNPIDDLARFYKALSSETRLRLLALLACQAQESALCVQRLAHDLQVTPSAVSQHLRILKHLGLVRSERHCHRIHYFLDQERLAAYIELARRQLGQRFVLASADEAVAKEEGPICCCDRKNQM